MSSHQTHPGNSTNENPQKTNTGNASNPSSNDAENDASGNQLLHPKAETYLREAGNIEDLPDDSDQQDMDATIQEK